MGLLLKSKETINVSCSLCFLALIYKRFLNIELTTVSIVIKFFFSAREYHDFSFLLGPLNHKGWIWIELIDFPFSQNSLSILRAHNVFLYFWRDLQSPVLETTPVLLGFSFHTAISHFLSFSMKPTTSASFKLSLNAVTKHTFFSDWAQKIIFPFPNSIDLGFDFCIQTEFVYWIKTNFKRFQTIWKNCKIHSNLWDKIHVPWGYIKNKLIY